MTRRIPFWKVESVGNDFVLVHEEGTSSLGDPEAVLPALTRAASHRRFGIGSDGLLVVGHAGTGLTLRMFNPDGSEDFCGNGLRCSATHAHALGWVGDRFSIRHGGRDVSCAILPDGRVSTIIGTVSYDPKDVPTTASGELFDTIVWSGMDAGIPLSLFGSALSTGSTHVVIPTVTLPDDDSFLSVSPKIEHDPRFPKKTSVIWRQEVSPNRLMIRIWERGAGETLGCGTGASAAAADYLRRKGAGGSVEVASAGGILHVEMDSWSSPMTVISKAEEVYTGTYLFEI